jgi:hypothetical protein
MGSGQAVSSNDAMTAAAAKLGIVGRSLAWSILKEERLDCNRWKPPTVTKKIETINNDRRDIMSYHVNCAIQANEEEN